MKSITRKPLKELLVPDRVQGALYLMGGFVILILLNIRNIWRFLNNQILGTVPAQTSLPGFLSTFSGNRLTQMLLWALLGLWVYVIFWFLRSISVNIYNDVVADHYLHPKNYQRSEYWKSVVSLKIFFVALTLTTISYAFLAISLLSNLSSRFYLAMENYSWGHSAMVWSLTILASAGVLYVLVTLLHLCMNSLKAIYKNF